jgi:hypothetical protein
MADEEREREAMRERTAETAGVLMHLRAFIVR